MPVVRMPDGKLVRFPDNMAREEIKSFVAEKYPDAYKTQQEETFDWSKVTPEMREQIAANNRDYDNQSYAGRMVKDAVTGAGEGIVSGLYNAADGATLGGAGWLDRKTGGNFTALDERLQRRADETGAVVGYLNNVAKLAAEIGGNVAGAGGAITKGLTKTGLKGMGLGLTDAAVQGGIYGTTSADNWADVPANAAFGAAGGVAFGAALGGTAGILGKFAGMLRKGGKNVKDAKAAIDSLRKELGDDAVNAMIKEARESNRSILEVVEDPKTLKMVHRARLQTEAADDIIQKNALNYNRGQSDRNQAFVDDVFGKESGYAMKKEATEAAKNEAKPYFDEMEGMGDLAAYEKNRNFDNFLLKNEAKYNNISDKGEENVFRQIRENGERGQVQLQSNPTATGTNISGEAEKSAALRELVGKGYSNGGTPQDGLFLRRNDGTGIFSVNPKYSDLFDRAAVNRSNYIQLKNTPDESRRFFDAITQAKKKLGAVGEQVWIYKPEEYQNMKLFLSEDGLSGVAVKPDGDIVSVFNSAKKSMEEVGSRAHAMVELAKQNGGTKLDAFDTFLPRLYSKHGFKETGRFAWDPKIAEAELKNWNKEYFKKWNNGEPDVVYMQLEKPQSPLANLVKNNDVIADTIKGVKRSLSSLKKASDTDARVLLEARKVLSAQTKSPDGAVKMQAINALEELDPVLKNVFGDKLETANKIYRDAYKFQEAYDAGRQVFDRNVPAEEFADVLSKMTNNERKALRGGLKDEVNGIIENRTNETLGWNRVVPRAVQEKIRMALGEKEGSRLINYANQEIRAMRNINEIIKGSPTADRTILAKLKDWKNTIYDTATGRYYSRRNRGIANIMTNPNVEVAERAFTEVTNPQGWEAVYQALTNPKSSQAKYNAALAAYLSNGMLNY